MIPENYQEALVWLFGRVAAFHNVGATAYKPGLERVEALSALFGNPHHGLRCIHVAGTNGKGSVSSTLAAILRSAGYKTGLYTSPHLVDFRERIRVDGEMISEAEVMRFLQRFDRAGSDAGDPSFFELTTVMAFDHFRRHAVDVAVIEVGLGGRLDSTNIITPALSVITNISHDHTALLGDTREQIASEKAGIIKPGVPVVVGEADAEVKHVFIRRAAECGSTIRFADALPSFSHYSIIGDRQLYYDTPYGTVDGQLTGECQARNAATVLASVGQLNRDGFEIDGHAVREGFGSVMELSGLTGRWQTVEHAPLTIIDTGHNVGGWRYTVDNLNAVKRRKVIVVGFVNDKDVGGILQLMRNIEDADFIFTQASVARALPAEQLRELADAHGLKGQAISDANEAFDKGRRQALDSGALLFIGGSNFVVADFLAAKHAD